MFQKKYSLLIALLVLAIFAVGSVSAADNITADSDVPADDIAVDDVSADLTDEQKETTSDIEADVADETENLRTTSYHVNNSMDLTTIQGYIDNAADGSTIYFDAGNYTGVTLTLTKSNVVYSGYGANLTGTGSNHVFNLANNLNNFTICGFNINVNDNSDEYSAIYGSFISNGNINHNTFYNGANGININKKYDNMTVEDNIIYGMTNDGISFAQPNSNSNINTLGNTYISRNNITNCKYGIFVGGNFKGVISDNNIVVNDGRSTPTWGIQSAGKKPGAISNIVANITGNTITGVQTGIEFINMTVISLNINYNNITTVSNTTYTIDYGTNFSVAANGEFYMYYNRLCGKIKKSLLDLCTDYYNYCDGDVDLNN
ncbi:hypothetical protein [Methanobrevibacter sp.]|uniref:hypothetical protein n=1 Tax=Methanobrevibacter sp. TaxID=66852 RepID=UPI0025CE6896|nr:hypothetical protein [Methanobrevibacter sp.]MBR4448191.1 hypothetical protein [Methanobrevibacter sp.]